MLTIVDGNNWFRRRVETTSFGSPVRSCFTEIQNIVGPVIVVWDGRGGKAARAKLYPAYKANRNKPADSFFETQNLFREILAFSKATQVSVDGYEGDDVIAHLVFNALASGMSHDKIFIQSNDADFLRLGVKMARDSGKVKPELMDAYKVLVGDSSDNIPGASKFGQKSWENCEEDQIEFLMAVIEKRVILTTEELRAKIEHFYPKAGLAWFLDEANQELLRTFLKMIRWLPMEWEVIEKNSVKGLNQPELAQPIFEKFMI